MDGDKDVMHDHIDGLDAALDGPTAAPEEDAGQEQAQPEQTGFEAGVAEGDADQTADGGDEKEKVAGEEEADKGTVPHAALHQERELHKATREALAQRDMTITSMNETFGKVMGNLGDGQQEARGPRQIEVPSVDEDPVGHFQATNKNLESRVEYMQGQQPSPEQAQAQHEQQQRQARAQAESNSAAEADPGFWHQYSFAQQAIRHDLKLQGYSAEQVEAIAWNWEDGMMGNAQNAGRPFPQLIKEFADGRGFQQWRQRQTGNGQKPSAGDKMAQLQAGAKAAVNVAGSGDAAPGKGKSGTLENLSSLQGSDFDKEFEIMKRSGRLG